MSLINRYIERNLDDSFSYQYERPNLEVLFTRENLFSPIADLKKRYKNIWSTFEDITFRTLYRFQKYIRTVCYVSGMRLRTLILTMHIIERYLAINKTMLQNIYLDKCDDFDTKVFITTCCFTAAKYEEIYPITLDNVVNVIQDTKTTRERRKLRKRIKKIEKDLLFALDFELTVSLTVDFFELFMTLCQLDEEEVFNALCLLERVSAYVYSSKFKCSEIASATCLVVMGDDTSRYNESVIERTGYTKESLTSCVFYLISLIDSYKELLLENDDYYKFIINLGL